MNPRALLQRCRAAILIAALGIGLAVAQAPDTGTGPGFDKHGFGHLDEPKARELAQVPGQEWMTQIYAREDRWQSSGVAVREGQFYAIEVTGEWQAGPFCNKSGASGAGIYTLLCFPTPFTPPILSGPTYGALIAKIGRDGRPFAVGDKHVLSADRDGVLYYRINDGMTFDNSGQLAARIRLQQSAVATVPAPARPPEARERESRVPAAPAATIAPSARSQHWAVVIGVSEYADRSIPQLRYASADAKAFHDWLVAADGGGYAPARTRLLVDRDATAANIRDALYTWLRQAIEEDVIVIYFAGHGSPDSPDTPQNLYLLPYDTRYDSVAATGFPMWDIETALKRFIKARRVVVVADACHSGGVGAAFDIARRSTPEANRISRGLQNLSTIGEGVAVLSASDDKQGSAEGTQFGGGHGVFTWFLLNGLRGEADYNKDGRVTLGELIPYISEQVRRATSNAQSPTIAGRFDPALSIGR